MDTGNSDGVMRETDASPSSSSSVAVAGRWQRLQFVGLLHVGNAAVQHLHAVDDVRLEEKGHARARHT